jgi:hypothetical protein
MSNYISDDYIPVVDAYDASKAVYLRTADRWPLQNDYWRNNPLSFTSYIRPNYAGYKPMKRYTYTVDRNEETTPSQEWKYAYYYPPGTIWPSNPQWFKTGEIILER